MAFKQKGGIMEYVCGFMFSEDRKKVLLIQKDRPEWQKGKLNGIGGKIEHSKDEQDTYIETALNAMVREFEEESGIKTNKSEWDLFAKCEGNNSIIYNFRAFSDKIFDYEQMESEMPIIVQPRMIVDYPTVPNVQWLIPMALSTKELFIYKSQIKG